MPTPSCLHRVPSFEMMQCMPAALEQTGTNIVTSRSAFILRFIEHDCALVNRSADHVLWLRDLVLAVDQRVRNDRAIGILSDAGSQRPAQFQNHGNDLRRRSARREFLLLLQDGHHSYDFEVAVLLFFLLTVFGRQMFARLRHDEPLQTMAYTFSVCFTCFGSSISSPKLCISRHVQAPDD